LAGWSGLVVAVGAVLWVAFREHSSTGLSIALGAVFGAVLIWVTLFRPRVTAYPEDLLMHGSVSDTVVPYALIDRVSLGQTLNIWVRGKRHVCTGIGGSATRDMREQVRLRGQGGLFAVNRVTQIAGAGDEVTAQRAAISYHDFVVTRISELVARAKARPAPEDGPPRVRRQWAWPELAALLVTGAAFVLSLVL
jgi:hypothetical protein